MRPWSSWGPTRLSQPHDDALVGSNPCKEPPPVELMAYLCACELRKSGDSRAMCCGPPAMNGRHRRRHAAVTPSAKRSLQPSRAAAPCSTPCCSPPDARTCSERDCWVARGCAPLARWLFVGYSQAVQAHTDFMTDCAIRDWLSGYTESLSGVHLQFNRMSCLVVG